MNLKKLTVTILEKNKTYGQKEGRPDNIQGLNRSGAQRHFDRLSDRISELAPVDPDGYRDYAALRGDLAMGIIF